MMMSSSWCSDRNIVDLDFMDKEMHSPDRGSKRSVYVISILNFNLDENAGNPNVRTTFRLYEEKAHSLLTDKVTFIFLELTKFRKELNELDGNILEGMYFCFKNMAFLKERPEILKHDVFRKIFEVSELLNMDDETRSKVLEKMTTERDLRNQMAYARQQAIEEGKAEGLAKGLEEGREKGLAQGRAEGRAEGQQEAKLEIARKFKELGIDEQTIITATGLDAQVVADL